MIRFTFIAAILLDKIGDSQEGKSLTKRYFKTFARGDAFLE
jgi:hypothetical protein